MTFLPEWTRRLCKPARYLAIKHPDKRKYDWYIPVVLSLITLAVCVGFTGEIALFGADGVFRRIQELIQLLIGFYIVALAAIATFPSNSLDAIMAGDPPTLREWDANQGEYVQKPLTRKRFLSYLFGYLSFLSIGLYLAILVADVLWPTAGRLICGSWLRVLELLTIGFISFFFWQLIVATFQGLYYLSDRIHRE